MIRSYSTCKTTDTNPQTPRPSPRFVKTPDLNYGVTRSMSSIEAAPESSTGGLKGIFQWLGKGITAAKEFAPVAARHLYKYGGGFVFILATTSMITLLPLVMESDRESRVRETVAGKYPAPSHLVIFAFFSRCNPKSCKFDNWRIKECKIESCQSWDSLILQCIDRLWQRERVNVKVFAPRRIRSPLSYLYVSVRFAFAFVGVAPPLWHHLLL